jgi:hypothetical protein
MNHTSKYIAAVVGLSIFVPAAAADNVSRKDIRSLVREEARKVSGKRGPRGDLGPQGHPGQKGRTGEGRGARGPAGPTGATGLAGPIGPAGPRGLDAPSSQTFSARVFADGSIEQETAVGITQDNVRRSDILDPDDPGGVGAEKVIRYCLSGLPRRMFGGQVTIEEASVDPSTPWNQRLILMPTLAIHVDTREPGCEQRIVVWNGIAQAFSEGNQAASFYLRLY